MKKILALAVAAALFAAPAFAAHLDPVPVRVLGINDFHGHLEAGSNALFLAVEAVRQMKQDGDRGLRTMGSLSLSRSLLEAGLVDRFRVVVFPVITGRTGRERIYDAYPDVMLELVDSRTFDGRLQLLDYVPTVVSGPPGGTTTG